MSNSTPRLLKVFLCHSSTDKPIVRDLYRRLQSEGWIDAWLDEEEIYPGQDWNLEIEKAVEKSDVIIVCLSHNSVTKEGYVQRELRIILDFADYKPEGTLFVIPIRLEDCEPPRRLRRWQYADYFPNSERERAYKRLLSSMARRGESLGILTNKVSKPTSSPGINNDLIGNTYKGMITGIDKKNGVFVKILPDIEGILPKAEIDSDSFYKIKSPLQIGTEVTVKVIDISPQGKIILSRRAAFDNLTAMEAREKAKYK